MATDSVEDIAANARVQTLIENPRLYLDTSMNFYHSYLVTRDLASLDVAVLAIRCVLNLPIPASDLRPLWLHLARPLLRRFQHTRHAEDQEEAFELILKANEAWPNGDPARRRCLCYLIIASSEGGGYLNESQVPLELGPLPFRGGVLELDPPDEHGRSRPSFENLVHYLGEDEEVFEYFWTTYVFDKERGRPPGFSLEASGSAFRACQQALAFFASERTKVGPIVVQMGWILTYRNFLSINFNFQTEQIAAGALFCSVGLNLMSSTSEFYGFALFYTSMAIQLQSMVLGSLENRHNAVRLAKRAEEVLKSQGPKSQSYLVHLAALMRLQNATAEDANALDAAATEDANALGAAIEHSTRATHTYEHKEDPSRRLSNFAAHLQFRARKYGRAEDTNMAVSAAQEAVDSLPLNDPRMALYLAVLADYEHSQFLKLNDTYHLRRAIDHYARANNIHYESHRSCLQTERAILHVQSSLLLSSYGNAMISSGEKLDDLDPFLDHAISAARESLSQRSAHRDPLVAAALEDARTQMGLCQLLSTRWRRTHNMDDINEAISRLRGLIPGLKDLSITIPALEPLSRATEQLGEFLYYRYKITQHDEDLEEALAVLLTAFEMSGSPRHRVVAGQLAVDILSQRGDWDSARKLSRDTVELMVVMCGRSMGWQDKQYWSRMKSNCAALYASVALEARSDAFDVIDTLETCRGVILGHLIDNCTELDDLAELAPEKAKRFGKLRDEINVKVDSSGSTDVWQTTRRIQAEGEIRACLEEIRTLDGFHRFLLGPTLSEIKAATAKGPIIIVNVSPHRSDAIIITKNGPVLLPLPKLKYEEVGKYVGANLTRFNFVDVAQKNRKYRQLQEWLWKNCVKLIFEKLDDLGNNAGRFHAWWIPIGIACFLPFHAAGIYTGDGSETALSRAISSYAPTLKALIHGRRKLIKRSPINADLQAESLTGEIELLKIMPRLAVIVMPSTPGMADLKGAECEAGQIQEIIGDLYSTQIHVQPSAKETMTYMENCEIMHFACHGESTPLDLSDSHLVLQTSTPDSEMPIIDKLSLRDVAAADVSCGKLAFLSACSTAQNEEHLWDEVLHLASGFLIAGYSHTVGNLWGADDEVSVQLVGSFYKHLIAAGELGDGDNVARALNEATMNVARRYPKQPLCWAQFVHFGV